MPCHLANLFEWVGGWVGSSYITHWYPSYMRSSHLKFKAHLATFILEGPGNHHVVTRAVDCADRYGNWTGVIEAVDILEASVRENT